MNYKIIILSLFAILPTVTFAAIVSVVQDTTIVLPSDSSTYTLSSGSAFDSLDVTTGDKSFSFTVPANTDVSVSSSDKKMLFNSAGIETSCGTSNSSVTFSGGNAGRTIQLTPVGVCTAAATASSGGNGPVVGSGGGGGGSYAPAVPATPAVPAVPGVSSATPAIPATPAMSTRKAEMISVNLLPGTTKADLVRTLQTLLSSDSSIYPEGIVNGSFGPATTRAVKRFQQKYGISQTGTVGPVTRAKINELLGGAVTSDNTGSVTTPSQQLSSVAITAYLEPGTTKADLVRTLQTLLSSDSSIYPEGIVNGSFGPATTRAVKRFQQKYGISQTGTVGPVTRAKINELFGR